MVRPLVIAIAIAAVLAAGDASTATETTYEVIVNPDNHATEIDRGFLRDVFLKKTVEWNDGRDVRPIDLAAKFPARTQFTHDVIGKTPSQLRSYWSQQIFSGKGVPPPETDSTAAVIAYVLAHPGAVGYLPTGTDPKGAKIVPVR